MKNLHHPNAPLAHTLVVLAYLVATVGLLCLLNWAT